MRVGFVQKRIRAKGAKQKRKDNADHDVLRCFHPSALANNAKDQIGKRNGKRQKEHPVIFYRRHTK